MNVLKNQTIYQCEYCGKRLLSKSGAILHEKEYCKADNSPAQLAIKSKQAKCKHLHTETVPLYLPGESVPVPDYEVCRDCRLKLD